MVPLLLYLTGKYLYKKYHLKCLMFIKKKSFICFYYKHEIFRNTTQLNTTQLIFFYTKHMSLDPFESIKLFQVVYLAKQGR